MEVEDLDIVEVELKYCERCGGLRLRLKGAQDVYCVPCAVKMSELPVSRKRKHWAHLSGNHRTEIRGRCEELRAICGEGGNA